MHDRKSGLPTRFSARRVKWAGLYLVAYSSALAVGLVYGDGSGLEFLYAMLLAAPWSFLLVPVMLGLGATGGEAPLWIRLALVSLGALVNASIIGFWRRRPEQTGA